MKWITLVSLLCLIYFPGSVSAQNTSFLTRTGTIHFFSSTPIEDIDAVNKNAAASIKQENMEMAWVVKIKEFRFKRALMEEHFNENYLESDRYPKAQFLGKLSGIQPGDLQVPGTYNVNAAGKLTIHGVTQNVTIPGKLEVMQDNSLHLVSEFKVNLIDYKIKVPKLVVKNIAEVIDVKVDATLNPVKN